MRITTLPAVIGRALRSRAGAFDLTSTLVGALVVVILGTGVSAVVFAGIPFAQDKAAQLAHDSTRTAQGMSKVQDGAFVPSVTLVNNGLLNGNGKVAADTDAGGTCYVAVSRSESGKFFFTVSNSHAPKELTRSSTVGCITAAQLQALVDSLGGWPPAAGGSSSSRTIPASANAPAAVVAFMNEDLLYSEAPEFLQGSLPGDDYSYPNWDAFVASPTRARWDAAYQALYGDAEASTAFFELLHRTDSGIPELASARDDAEVAFWNDPNPVTQKAFVDALHALYTGALDAPQMTFTAATVGATFTPIGEPSTPAQDGELQLRYANAALAYEASWIRLYQSYWNASAREVDQTSGWEAADDYYQQSYGHSAALDASPAGTAWLDMYRLPGGSQVNLLNRTIMENITNRTDAGIPGLYADMQAKKAAFESSGDLAEAATKQQAYVDALRLMYATALAAPPAHSDLHAVATTNSFTVAAGSTSVIRMEMQLPAGASVNEATLLTEEYGAFASLTMDRPVNGGNTWAINMDGPATQSVRAGVYQVVFKLKDPATGLSFYRDFTITVQ